MTDLEEKLKESVYFIEATSFEHFCLYQEHKLSHLWAQDLSGGAKVIGFIDGDEDKPVNVSFTFAIILHKRVCFYDVISRYSDSVMVEEWLDKNYPVTHDNGMRKSRTDATNFHHVIRKIVSPT